MILSLILDNFFTRNWRKILLVIFFIIIFVFVIIGLIGALVRFIMKKQAKAVDKDMSKMVVSRLIDNPKDFKEIANIKSMDRFFKASPLPICLLLGALILYLIYGFTFQRWTDSLLSRETGIGSLLYLLDFSSIEYVPPLGINWDKIVWLEPAPFSDERIFNYFIFLLTFIGGIIYLIDVQAYVARKYRINKLSKEIYSVDLGKMDLSSFYNNSIKNVDDKNEK